MMTRKEARAVYHAGEAAVVRVLLDMERRIHVLEQQVLDLTKRLEQSAERVRHLEDRLARNSHNSNKPPSSDGFGKPAPKSLRTRGARKTGGQPGHPGHTLKMADQPDHTELHRVCVCTRCGRSLADRPADAIEKRQVHDLPPLRLLVTEHQVETKICDCGHRNKAAFPEDVNAPVQYGKRIKSAAICLKGYQTIPYERGCELLGDLFGCTLCQGTLANIIAQADGLAADPVERIREQVTQASLAHFDETGTRVEGKLWWLHSASTSKATCYDIHRKRGREAFDANGILPAFRGRAIHDFWRPYLRYSCLHGLCNAHHLRELIFVHEQHQQGWAGRMIECLLDIKAAVDAAKHRAGSSARTERPGRLAPKQIKAFEARYQQILDEGYAQNPLQPPAPDAKKKRGRRKKTTPRNLLERLDEHRAEALAFMYDLSVPFDNNQAERDLRMMKVQQKISGTFRTEDGAKSFCRIRSYISTARKNAIGAFEALTRLFEGNPFVPTPDSS